MLNVSISWEHHYLMIKLQLNTTNPDIYCLIFFKSKIASTFNLFGYLIQLKETIKFLDYDPLSGKIAYEVVTKDDIYIYNQDV